MSDHLCGDKKQAAADADKAAARKKDGKAYFECKKCGRTSHKEDHLCKPDKVKGK